MLGEKLKALREGKGLLLRQVAAELQIDTAYIWKMEHGEKPASRTHLKKLAALYEVPESELMVLWLSDKIVDLVKDEPVYEDSLKLSMNRMNNLQV